MSNTHHSHAYASLYALSPARVLEWLFREIHIRDYVSATDLTEKGFKTITQYLEKQHENLCWIWTSRKEKKIRLWNTDSFRNSTVFLNTTKLFSIWCCLLSTVCCLQFSCKKSSCRHKCLNKDKTCHMLPSLTPPHIAFSLKFININNWKHWCSFLGY